MTTTELSAEVASTNGDSAALEEDAESTVLAQHDILSGKLEMSGDGQVLGKFTGEIACLGELLIGPDAHVDADIKSSRITIAGYVRGNVVATNRLKIASTGRLEGDARVGALVVQEGGVHVGVIRVHPEGVPEGAPFTDGAAARAPVAAARPEPSPVAKVRKFWGEFF